MSEEKDRVLPRRPAKTRPRRPPYILVWISVLALSTIVVLAVFTTEIDQGVPMLDPGAQNVLMVMIGFLVIVAWVVWAAFFSGLPQIVGWAAAAALCLLLVAGVVLVQVVPQGDLSLARLEWRFAQRAAKLPSVDEGRTADLTQTSVEDFPQFLGPHRDGRLPDWQLEVDWQQRKPQRLWRIEVGAGWSGFAAVGDYAVTMEQRGNEEAVVCYEVDTGRTVWVYHHTARHFESMGGEGPRSTPTIHAGDVYALGATGMLVRLNGSDGQLRWKVNLLEYLGIPHEARRNILGWYIVEKSNLNWGRAASPLIHENLVIVPGGGPSGGPHVSLLAFDIDTGQEVWRGGTDPISYSSPTFATLAGVPQILVINESTMAGYDPQSGRELWSYPRPGSSSGGANTSQVTVVSENRVLATKGYGLGAEVVELTAGEGGQLQARQVWQSQRDLRTRLTFPVIHQGYAYGLSEGILNCVDLETGQRMWQQGRFGHGQLLLVGDKLLVQSERGQIAAVRATPQGYEELGRFDSIHGVCWNTLCLRGDRLLVRSDIEASCFVLNVTYRGEPQVTDTDEGLRRRDVGLHRREMEILR